MMLSDTTSKPAGIREVPGDTALDIPDAAFAVNSHAGDLLDRLPNVIWHPLRAIGWGIAAAIGGATIVVALAVLAAIPILNFFALGYLLEAEGRVARSGRFRDGFPLIRFAPRVGVIVLCVWVWILPLRLLSSMAADALLLDPAGRAASVLRTLTAVAAMLIAAHLGLALFRGGSPGCFVRPIKNLRYFLSRLRSRDLWEQHSAAVTTWLSGLQPGYYFSLGARGFAGAMLWLIVPTAFFAAARRTDGLPILVTLFGGLLLMLVLSWVPFLQARFAAENRFRAMFELSTVRELYRRRPLLWLLSILFVYLLALPLYLFKVAAPPRDALWFVTVVFISSIYPARLWTGWAYHRAAMRNRHAHFLFRWGCGLLMVPLLGLYVFLLYFSQFIGEHGRRVLFEHHAFLLPAPF